MRKHLCLIAMAAIVAGSMASAEEARVIVAFKGKPNAKAIQQAGGRVKHTYRLIPACAATMPAPAAKALARHPLVLRIEPDLPVYAVEVKAQKPGKKPPGGGKGDKGDGQPPQVLPWGVARVDAEWAWPTATGAGVKVAVLDTGIDKDHPDLQVNIAGGVNFVRRGRKLDPTKWDDDDGHGTHCAGIIAAANNEIGVVGVAPQASLYAVKVLNSSGTGYWSDVVAALDWCVANGVHVASMSLSSPSYAYPGDSVRDACSNAYAAGLLLVAAAGNDADAVGWPAAFSSVVGVGATGFDGNGDYLAGFSNTGPEIELVAPGVYIPSTYRGGGYKELNGTSMACPHVSGAAALVLSALPSLSPGDVRAMLASSADDLGPAGPDDLFGFGLLDAQEATTGSESGDD